MGSGHCLCNGMRLGPDGFDEYLAGRVRERYYDVEGTKELIEGFSSTGTTDFAIEKLKSAASYSPPMESWRVGESLSECFLEDYRNAKFPYRPRRDLKNPDSSPAGADLLGYFCRNGKMLFLFGEVKTSAEQRHPPSVAVILMKQLEDLKLDRNRMNLIAWIFFKVHNLKDENPKKENFMEALDSYSKEIVKTVGVLIRDMPPDERDVKHIFAQLEKDQQTPVELLVLYLPRAVGLLPEMVKEHRYGRE